MPTTDRFNPSAMHPDRIPITFLDETASTNDVAKHLLQAGTQPMVVVATAHQTAGRGQRGNRWESAPGQNLLFTIGVRPTFLPAQRQFLLLQTASVAICEALDEEKPGCRIKWPNDHYYGERKVAGTLIETSLSGQTMATCVVGTGINLNQTAFTAYPPNPVSLRQLTGRVHDGEALLQRILIRFKELYESLKTGHDADIRQAYMDHLLRREGTHAYSDDAGPFRATLEGIEDDGHLLLRDTFGQRRRYAFKEVRFTF